MEEGGNELEFDEFEKLLGEIPNVTSGNAHRLEFGSKTNCQSLENFKSLEVEKISVAETQRCTNLPDEQSLSSAFADFSFNDGGTEQIGKTEKPCQFHHISRQQSIPSFWSLHPLTRESNHELEMAFFPQNKSVLLKPEVEESNKGSVGYVQSYESLSSPPLPFSRAVEGFDYLPHLQFPVLSHQHKIFFDEWTQHPAVNLRQTNQIPSGWKNMEVDHFYRMHQHYSFLQPIRNHQYFEMPVSHRLQRSNHDSLMKQYGIYNSMPTFDSGLRRSFPQNIPIQPFRAKNFEAIEREKSFDHVIRDRRILTNNHIHDDRFSSSRASPGSKSRSIESKSSISEKNAFDEFRGLIYRMAKDQHGCRLLQTRFSKGTYNDVGIVFNEVISHVVELMTDRFGNYLVQKLLEVCDEDQRMKILHEITKNSGDLVRISCDIHGTRAIQRVIETLKTPEQFSLIVSSLKTDILALMKHVNGNHVPQRCLQHLMPEYREFLFDAATKNCVELSTDRHGCCVLQKCLNNSDAKQRCNLISEITANALFLSQDPFGNYVVQFVLELQLPHPTIEILKQMEGRCGDLARQKYSSNVVEKCLRYAGEDHMGSIIDELIYDPRFDQIMQDPYGNYVVQSALVQSKGALHHKLVAAITARVSTLRTNPFGKKILSCDTFKRLV